MGTNLKAAISTTPFPCHVGVVSTWAADHYALFVAHGQQKPKKGDKTDKVYSVQAHVIGGAGRKNASERETTTHTLYRTRNAAGRKRKQSHNVACTHVRPTNGVSLYKATVFVCAEKLFPTPCGRIRGRGRRRASVLAKGDRGWLLRTRRGTVDNNKKSVR